MTVSPDSVIVIDYLNGVPEAGAQLGDGNDVIISVITWIEVLTGARTADEHADVRAVLDRFRILGVTQPIAEEAVRIRRERRLKLPDAIILATAHQLGVPLITRNTKDFDASAPDILVPYTL